MLDRRSTSGGINRKYFRQGIFIIFESVAQLNVVLVRYQVGEVTVFFRGESFELGEKRNRVWLWSTTGRRRRHRSKRLQQISILDSTSVDSLEAIVANTSSNSFWRMWHVGTVPGKLGDAFGILMRYAHQSFAILLCPM